MTALATRDASRAAGPEGPGGAAACARTPRDGTWIVAVLAVTAVAATVGTVRSTGQLPTLAGAIVLAVGIVAGDLLTIELPFRRGGRAIFGLSEAALAAGLLILPAPDVAVGTAMGVLPSLLLDHSAPPRRSANLATYAAGGSCAALIVSLLGPLSSTVDLRGALSAGAGVGCFLAICTAAVTRLIALDGGRPWTELLRTIVPTAVMTGAGGAGLGVLAVVLWQPAPWAVPLLAVPVVALHTGARRSVRAHADQERTADFVTVERWLSEASTPEAVATALGDGARLLLGGSAAVWAEGAWGTAVPAGSGPCLVDPDQEPALVRPLTELGPAAAGLGAAIGYGGGVLVVWDGRSGGDTRDWLQRLARSARLHRDRAVAALALERERATVRAVVDGTADGIFAVDAEGVVRLWNPGMAKLSGVPAGRALGRAVTAVLGTGPWSRVGSGDVVREGDVIWCVSTAAVAQATEPTGRTTLLVTVVHDVTAERLATRMRDTMLAVVSHELRTPLTPIKASAQLLQQHWDRIPAPKRSALLAQIDERASHLACLVDDLLLAGQLSSGDRPTLSVRHLLLDLAAHLRQSVEHLADARPTHRLVVDAPDTLPVRSDPTRLRQVIDNLVDNACKFSPAGATVHVALHAERERAVLVVRDEGRGIPAGDLDRVFERFERVEDPLHMTTSGAGLGLFIVRAVVAALGGEVSIASRLGAGTAVTVTVPRQPAAAARPTG